MAQSDAALCLLAHTLPELSDRQLAHLLLHFGSPRSLWEAPPDQWREQGASGAACAAAKVIKRHGLVSSLSESLQSLLDAPDISVLYLGGPHYPALLAEIHDPPPVLYVRGDKHCLNQPQLAIVGSRRASSAGRRAAGVFAAQAVAAGFTVTSGLAQGIDGEAHEVALGRGGTTVAVMATGIDAVYPHQHRVLADAIAASGCLVTEFAPGTRPERWRFPQRNRIVSGLSLAIVVAEAAEKSGSLISARLAMEQNRPVLAVPHSLFHAGGAGGLQLLREGAALACSFDDVLAQTGALQHWQQAEVEGQLEAKGEKDVEVCDSFPPLSPDQTTVLSLLGYEAISADELINASPLSASQTLAALTALELEGSIERVGGGFMRR